MRFTETVPELKNVNLHKRSIDWSDEAEGFQIKIRHAVVVLRHDYFAGQEKNGFSQLATS